MNAWQVDEMWETESGRLWEELNAPDPNQGRYEAATVYTGFALDFLNKAVDSLIQAADEVDGLPLENQILSLVTDLEERGICIAQLGEN